MRKRRVAAAILALALTSCAGRYYQSTGPGDIPPCTSGSMRCWSGSIWACDTTGRWIKVQNCANTDEFCYDHNPGMCGSQYPCCAK